VKIDVGIDVGVLSLETACENVTPNGIGCNLVALAAKSMADTGSMSGILSRETWLPRVTSLRRVISLPWQLGVI